MDVKSFITLAPGVLDYELALSNLFTSCFFTADINKLARLSMANTFAKKNQ